MGDVISKFMDPLRRIFSLPKNAEGKEEEFFEAYFRVLDRYDDEVLNAASLRIIETHKVRVFPLPAECVEACRIAKDARDAPDLTKPAAKDRYPEWSDEARALAKKLFATCSYSQEALSEDWALTLYDFLRVNGRWPNSIEADRLRTNGIASSRKFWAMVGEETPVEKRRNIVDVSHFIKMRREKVDNLRQIVLDAMN